MVYTLFTLLKIISLILHQYWPHSLTTHPINPTVMLVNKPLFNNRNFKNQRKINYKFKKSSKTRATSTPLSKIHKKINLDQLQILFSRTYMYEIVKHNGFQQFPKLPSATLNLSSRPQFSPGVIFSRYNSYILNCNNIITNQLTKNIFFSKNRDIFTIPAPTTSLFTFNYNKIERINTFTKNSFKMKRYALLLLLTLALSVLCHRVAAQSVVYYCYQTGAIGYAYTNVNDGHDPYEAQGRDLKSLEKTALSNCQLHGGTQCALLYETGTPGWNGIIKGRDQNNSPIVLAVGHQQSEKFAQSELDRQYFFQDGIQFDDVLILTWKAE